MKNKIFVAGKITSGPQLQHAPQAAGNLTQQTTSEQPNVFLQFTAAELHLAVHKRLCNAAL
jgi:hypothetical protein